MDVGEFVGKLMQHVPPKGCHLVRGYGAYSGNVSPELLARLREALPLSAQIRVVLHPRWPQPDDIEPRPQECPTCGAALYVRYYGRAAPGLVA
jgi:hypothetical protein